MTDLPKPLAEPYRRHLSEVCRRVEAAIEREGAEGAAFFAGDLRYVHRDDRPYTFAPAANFTILAPLHRHPGCIALIRPGEKPLLVYPQSDDFWHVPPADLSGDWVDQWEVRTVRDAADARRALPSDLSRIVAVGEDPPAGWGFGAENPENLLTYLDFHRGIKTDYEIACLERASILAARGHEAAGEAFFAGGSEFDIHQLYLQACGQTDLELPYQNIVARGDHAAVLHYQFLDREPRGADSLLVDAGASFLGYAADISRTWSSDAQFTALIDEMDDLQQALVAEAAPGKSFVDLNESCHEKLAELLVRADIARMTPEAALETGITRTFLPHGLGHLLGLQVHDVGGHLSDDGGNIAAPPEAHPWLRLTRNLVPGMTTTIEPGLYFIDSLLVQKREEVGEGLNWTLIEELKPFGGIRVEDNIVVAEHGARNLTRPAFEALAG